MSKYTQSNYVVNKFSKNIVYCFSDRIVEVTLSDYLQENPDKTEEDFNKLKVMSDEMFYQEDRADSRHNKKKLSLDYIKENDILQIEMIDVEIIHKQDRKSALRSAYELLDGKELTEKQKKRFMAHFFKNRSLRQIADDEGVHFTSVNECIGRAVDKLKNIFGKF